MSPSTRCSQCKSTGQRGLPQPEAARQTPSCQLPAIAPVQSVQESILETVVSWFSGLPCISRYSPGTGGTASDCNVKTGSCFAYRSRTPGSSSVAASSRLRPGNVIKPSCARIYDLPDNHIILTGKLRHRPAPHGHPLSWGLI